MHSIHAYYGRYVCFRPVCRSLVIMGKLKRFLIQLDTPNGVYYSGQAVSGQVFLDLKDEMKLRGMSTLLTQTYVQLNLCKTATFEIDLSGWCGRWLSYKGTGNVILLAKLNDMYLYKTDNFFHINHYLKSVSKVALLYRFYCIHVTYRSLLKPMTHR